MQKNFIFATLVLSVSLFITGCIVSNPPVLHATLETGNFLNPNVYNQSSPVVVTFYQLKSATIFEQVDFFSLYDNPAKTLGTDLIDKYEVELRPEKSQEIHFNLSSTTNYIGVVAAFRLPDHTQWRQVIPVTQGKSVQLQATIGAESIMVIKK